jgi:zinc transporter ZupT
VVTSIGILAISRFEEKGREYSSYFVCFAAGVLISVSFLHIIPRSFAMNTSGPWFLLLGFLALLLLSRFLSIYACQKGEDAKIVARLLPVLAIGLHSLIDGVMYSVTFRVSVFTGALAACGMVLHEFPEGVVTYVLLRRGGLDRSRSSLYAFLAAALSTPVGAVLSFPFIRGLRGGPLGALLAVTAGALVYVGATHLLPEVESRARKSTLLAMAAGVAIAVVIVAVEA